MKIKYLLVILSFITMSSSFAVNDGIGQGNALVAVEYDFQHNRISDLSDYLSEPVELVFDNSFDVYSKKQARLVLKNFFEANPAESFTISHSRKKDNANYVIGLLQTDKKTYRIYMLMKDVESKTLIQHLRIDLQH